MNNIVAIFIVAGLPQNGSVLKTPYDWIPSEVEYIITVATGTILHQSYVCIQWFLLVKHFKRTNHFLYT